MAKAARSATPSRSAAPAAKRPSVPPDWPVIVLAALGALLTAYLTFSALNATVPALCAPGSGCDLVQQSRWSRLLGLPIALWGFGLYALIAILAALPSKPVKRWRRLWVLALLGVGISLYLTLTGLIALDATCAWCLTSLALMLALFVWLSLRRPDTGPGVPWPQWLAGNAIILATAVGLVYANQSGVLQQPENPRLQALAQHLSDRGAKFYGSYWCPRCIDQKELFGRSADRLPYIECNPNGRNGALAFECAAAEVQAYPTWVIRGRSYPQVLSPEELARRSAFDWDGFKSPED